MELGLQSMAPKTGGPTAQKRELKGTSGIQRVGAFQPEGGGTRHFDLEFGVVPTLSSMNLNREVNSEIVTLFDWEAVWWGKNP